MCVFVVLSSRILLYRERKRDQNDFADDERFRRVREEREEARLRHLRFFLSSSRDKESSSFLDDDDICVCDPKRDEECRDVCDVVCYLRPPFRRPSRRAVALFGVQIAEISAFSRLESPRRRGHAGVSERADETHGECVPDTRGSV